MTDPALHVDGIVAACAPGLRAAYRRSVAATKAALDRDALAEALAARDPYSAMAICDTAIAVEGFHAMQAALQEAALIAGRMASSEVDSRLKAIRKRDLRFNFLAPRIAAATQAWVSGAIDYLTSSTRAALFAVMTRGLASNLDTSSIVREVLAAIGAEPRTVEAAGRMRQFLATMDREQLRRLAREGKVDEVVSRALDNGRTLDQGQIDKRVEGLLERSARYRADTMANYGASTAAHRAVHEAWRQAVEEGFVEPDAVTKRWVHRHDGRVRDTHLSIPVIQPDGVPLEGYFTTSAASRLRFPKDPEAPAAEVFGCRCVLQFSVAG